MRRDRRSDSEGLAKLQIRPIKVWVAEHLTRGSPLRELIIQQNDEIDPLEYVQKTVDWLRLLTIERKAGSR